MDVFMGEMHDWFRRLQLDRLIVELLMKDPLPEGHGGC